MNLEKNQSTIAIWISLISNVALTVLKIVIGFLFGSKVLLADGFHNAGDVIATAASLSSMSVSKRPADSDHPYGHGKAEVVGSGFVAVVLVLAAIYIAYESIIALFHTSHKATFIALFAAIVSVVWKQALYVYTIRVGKNTRSKGLIATAYDHLADVYASSAAVIGIGLALIGDHYHIALLSYGDPVAGIIVSYFVIKLAYQMGSEAVDVLMEKNVSPVKIDEYISLIQLTPLVKRIDRIRARELGHYVLIDLRISVPAELSIQEGHDISRGIKQKIMEHDDEVGEVLIHLNPWYE